MAFGRIFQVRLLGKIHGQQYVNVFHFGTNENAADNAALIALMDQLAAAMITCALNFLLPAVTSDFNLEGIGVQQLHPFISDEVEDSVAAGSVGQRGTCNASFESILMRVKTGFAGKRKRGRHFLPPPGDVDLLQSLLQDGPAAIAFSEFIDCIVDNFIGASANTPFRLGVLSAKTLQENPGNYDLAFTEAANLQIEQSMTSLRSRKVGHGG